MKKSDDAGNTIMDYLPSYLISIHPGGHAIYLVSIFIILAVLASLPLVSVQVSVAGRGIIRPQQEKSSILASSTGIVSKVFVEEGERIQKSEPLIQIRSIETMQNLQSLIMELQEAELHVKDLRKLISRPMALPRSPKYLREYDEYLNRLDYLGLLLNRANLELSRHEGLFRGGLISEKDYDDLVFAVNKSEKELESYKYQSITAWQKEYYTIADRIRKLHAQIRNTEEKIRMTTVYAPATGSMIEFNGIFEGSMVQAGSVIGVLSPESGLIGEFYVSSTNLIYLKKGQKVHLHLEAFNAREWGVLPGRIYEISSDYILVENQPVYRIKCRLERGELNLRNGYSAKIRKGMTFQARCMVSRRTLFQLLADKTGNWLNPTLNKLNEKNPGNQTT